MLINQNLPVFDCIGIGAGPSNLSLACLLNSVKNIRHYFFEQNDKFVWHEGLLLQGTSIQVSIFKDLVSLVDPTSRYTFTNFLHEKQRFYQFINAGYTTASRAEFNQYLQWVCERLDTLKFSHKVENIEFEKEFIVKTNFGIARAQNIVLGIGQKPFLPKFVKNVSSETIIHASDYLKTKLSFKNKRVAIVGGGQSGAEIFLHLSMLPKEDFPSECYWISKRSNYLPLDDSPFTNEFFMPDYSNYFHKLSLESRQLRLQEQKLASNGISPETLKKVYQTIYENNFLKKDPIIFALRPGRELVEIRQFGRGWQLITKHVDGQFIEECEVDIVIFATGYSYHNPSFLDSIAHRIQMNNGEPIIKSDFSVLWDGPHQNRIYIQNWAMTQRGIADPNLSLTAWRSAKIVNSLAGKNIYKEDCSQSTIDWDADFSTKIPRIEVAV